MNRAPAYAECRELVAKLGLVSKRRERIFVRLEMILRRAETKTRRAPISRSNQKHLEGKSHGPYSPRKRIARTTLSGLFERKSIAVGDFDLDFDSRIGFLHWDGYHSIPHGCYKDSVSESE